MTWVDGPSLMQSIGVLKWSMSLWIHRKVGRFRSIWMVQPMNGKGVGPGGNPGWLVVVFLIKYLRKKMEMMMIVEMLTTWIAIDEDEEGCIWMGNKIWVDLIIGKKLYMNCDGYDLFLGASFMWYIVQIFYQIWSRFKNHKNTINNKNRSGTLSST